MDEIESFDPIQFFSPKEANVFCLYHRRRESLSATFESHCWDGGGGGLKEGNIFEMLSCTEMILTIAALLLLTFLM